MTPATPRPTTGWSIPIAALGEEEAEVEEEVLEPEEVPDVAVDPDLPVVLVALLTLPVVTVLFLLPEGTIAPEADEEGYGAVTKVDEFKPVGGPAGTVAGVVTAAG